VGSEVGIWLIKSCCVFPWRRGKEHLGNQLLSFSTPRSASVGRHQLAVRSQGGSRQAASGRDRDEIAAGNGARWDEICDANMSTILLEVPMYVLVAI
jgi:hypothetical protein